MKRYLLGFIVSMLVHSALIAGAYIAFANDRMITPKEKPKSTPLKLSMFVPPVEPVVEPIVESIVQPTLEPVVEIIKKVIPPPKPAVKKEKKAAKIKPKVVKKKAKPKKKKAKKKVVVKPKPKPKARPKVTPRPKARPVVRAKPVNKPRSVSRPPQRSVVRPKPVVAKPTRPRSTPAANHHHIKAFKTSVKRAIDNNKRYPMSSRRRNQQGTAMIAFTLMRDGSVKNARVVRSSGFKRLDQAALKAVKGIHRRIPIPKQLNRASWNFSVPIQFGLQ